jgi:hypothetical protein
MSAQKEKRRQLLEKKLADHRKPITDLRVRLGAELDAMERDCVAPDLIMARRIGASQEIVAAQTPAWWRVYDDLRYRMRKVCREIENSELRKRGERKIYKECPVPTEALP